MVGFGKPSGFACVLDKQQVYCLSLGLFLRVPFRWMAMRELPGLFHFYAFSGGINGMFFLPLVDGI